MTFKDILDRISDGFIALDKNWKYVYLNKMAEEIAGKSQQELSGKNIWEVFDTLIETEFYNACQRAMNKQEPVFLESYYQQADKWFESHFYPSTDGLTIHFRDITGKKKAEEENRKHHERIEMITSMLKDGIWEWNIESGEVWANEGYQKMYGLGKNDPVPSGEEWLQRVHPDDRKIKEKQLENIFSSDIKYWESEYRFLKYNGEIATIFDRCYVLRNKEGKPLRMTATMIDITDRKQAEEKIKKHSERIEMIANAVHDSLWEWNLETGEIWGNEGHQQLYGKIAGNKMPTVDDWKLKIHPDDVEAAMKPLEEALAKNLPYWESEYRFLKDTGEYATHFSRCYAIRNDEGKITRIAGTIIDITERKKNEERIKKYNERFEMIARVLHDAIWEWNLETGELWANEVHQQLFGLTQADPVPTVDQWFGQIHPEDRERVKKTHREALATDIDYWEIEYRFLKSTGEYLMISDRSYILRNSEGKAIWLTGTMNDITERKNAEEELKASEETRRLIMESSLDAIVCINTDGIITRWTKQAETIFGWKEEEVIGKPLAETIIPEQYRQQHNQGFRNYLQTGNSNVLNKLIELTAINKEGVEFPVELSIVEIDQGKEKFFCGFIKDITERKKVEQLLLASEKSLREILSSSAERFYVIDKSCKITLINKVAEAKLTEAWGHLVTVGTNILDFIPPEEKEPVRESLQKVFAGEEVEYELYWDKDDPPTWVTVNYRPVYDDNNNVTGAYIATKDITERKKAETEIINAKELADRLIESLPGVFYFFDQTGKMLRWNKQAEIVTGYSTEEMAVMNPADFFTGETREQIIEKIKEAFENGESHIEADFTTKSGQKAPYYFKSIRMFYEGRPCLVGAAIDISERKKAEAEIIKERELSDRLIESLPGSFYLIDPAAGKLIRWNKKFETGSEYSAKEIAGMRPSDFLTGQSKALLNQKILEVFQKGEADAEVVFTSKSGRVIPYYLKASMIMYEGRPCIIGTGIDLIARKKAEAEIIKARELADKLIDSLPGTFYLFDNTGKLLRWNRQLEIVTGYSTEEMEAMSPVDFFPKEIQPVIVEKITHAFETGGVDVEANVITKEGRLIPYFLKAARIFYDDKPCVVGTGTDITERVSTQKKLEESLLEIRQLTEHLHKIREEERSHIAREIHDELGQQLTVLKMDVAWLNKKLQSDEPIRLKLNELSSMLDETVKTVRRISSELRPSLLDDLGLVAAMDWHLREFEKRTGVQTIFDEPASDIQITDKNLTGLFRIFQESLTNVARHAEAKTVSVELLQNNGNIILSITDNGKGFDGEDARNKRTLGILGMKERALMMGGLYDINSEPGKGTTVVVSIPADK